MELDELDIKEKNKIKRISILETVLRYVAIFGIIGEIIFWIVIFGGLILDAKGKPLNVLTTVTHTKTEKQISMSGEVRKEKGKETTYLVHCLDDSFPVSKDNYDKYIKIIMLQL